MSIWSTLGKIGAIGAAPFTGGASLGAIPLIDAFGNVAGEVAKGREANRNTQAGQNFNQDQLRLRADENRLASAKFNAAMPGQRANDAVRGDTLANIQDAAFTGSGRDLGITGGLRPSLLSGQTRALGQAMGAAASGNTGAGAQMDPGRAALLQQLAGSYQPFQPNFTTPTELPKANALDAILQLGGITGKFAHLANNQDEG
jgi:hypothetical protein